MIDKEYEVYTRVREALDKSIDMTTVYVNKPRHFPYVFMQQTDDYTVYEDGSVNEKYAALSFDINIFSNLQEGRHEECKRIAKTIDSVMRAMNFQRTAMVPLRDSTQTTVYGVDVHDQTVSRLVLRYEGVASETHFYRR